MLTKCATVIAITVLAFGCDRDEKRIAALEQRVGALEAQAKTVAASQVPATATTPEPNSSRVVDADSTTASSQMSAVTQSSASPAAPPLPTETVSGVGKQATRMLTLREGLYVLRLTHSGGSNFIVHLLDSSGRKVDSSLVNVVGPFSGSKALRISTPGQYLLDIEADGPWSVVVGPP